MTTGAIEITRYPNRRLYDRSTGQYVTLQELEERIRNGQNIVVTDSKTGEDLTRSILTQMILEHHPERMELFPISFLHVLLRANDMALDWMRAYLRQSFAILEGMAPSSMSAPPVLPPTEWFESLGRAWQAPFAAAPFPFNFTSPQTPSSAASPPAPAESPPSASAANDRDALLARLQQLEQRLGQLEGQRPGRRRSK